MSAKRKLVIAVVLLILLGGGVAFYKSVGLGVPFWQGEKVHDWQIEAKVSFLATGKPVKVRLSLPAAAVDENKGVEAGSLGYHFNIETNQGAHTALWASESREDGQSLFYRVRIPESTSSGAGPIAGDASELDAPGLAGAVGAAADTIVKRALALSSDSDALFVEFFRPIKDANLSQEFGLVKRYYEQEFKGDATMVMGIDLLKMAGVPARVAYGVTLQKQLGAQTPVRLVEYYDGSFWKVRNPLTPEVVLDGKSVYVWHRGGGALLDVTGGENSNVVFTVSRETIPQSSLTDLQDSPLLISTILGLPLAERAVFRYIVLIPLGAFVVVLMRNIIGIPTLGTFMPVLIALALLEIPIGRGLIMFSILVAVGLWFRFLLSRLNLLVVPRVAACVVIVTLLMIIMSVLGNRIGVSGGAQITLFPMIIIAWTIERMSLIWEEEGKHSALTQVGGSLIVSILAYLFMKIGQIQYWAFYFPELLLVLLAGILMIGRYTGYRCSELIRFKSFAES